MSKRTIFFTTLALFLAGILLGKNYYDKKEKEETKNINPGFEKTTLTEPKPEINQKKIIINPSGAVTFLLAAHDVIYYYTGGFTGLLTKTEFKNVGAIIKRYTGSIDSRDLMFVIKEDKNSTFKNAVDLLDEMEINKVPKGHYLETDITDEEIKSVKKYNEN